MMKKAISLLLCIVASWGSHLAIYDGFASVCERAEPRFEKGSFVITDLPKTILSDSLHLQKAPGSFAFIKGLDKRSILRSLLGKEVSFFYGKKLHKGVVIGSDPLIIKADKIYWNISLEDIVFKDLPKGVYLTPTILFSEKPPKKMDLCYICEGVTWRASYSAKLLKRELFLEGFAHIRNASGHTFKGAKVTLVAGEVNRKREFYPVMKSAIASPKPKEIAGYYRYDIPKVHDIDKERFIHLFSQKIPFAMQYFAHFGDLAYPFGTVVRKVDQILSFRAPSAMPAGSIRFYKDGIFIGEGDISHTSKGQKIRIVIGKHFDIFVKRVSLAYEDTKRAFFHKVRYELHNKTKKGVKVLIQERIATTKLTIEGGDVKILDSDTLQFSLHSPSGRTTSITLLYSRKKD